MRTNDFVKERDEQTARNKCWQGVLESWQSTGHTPDMMTASSSFNAGWSAQNDFIARAKRDTAAHLAANKPKEDFPSMEATENFAAVGDGQDPSKPPLGPMAATTEWYWKRTPAPDGERDAFTRGWNGAALWNNRRIAEENLKIAAAARKTFARCITNAVDAALLCQRAQLTLDSDMLTDRCVACGQQDDLHLVQGEMACIECIDARIDTAESDLDALRQLLRPRVGESVQDACRRVRDSADGNLDAMKPRMQHAYERGVLARHRQALRSRREGGSHRDDGSLPRGAAGQPLPHRPEPGLHEAVRGRPLQRAARDGRGHPVGRAGHGR